MAIIIFLLMKLKNCNLINTLMNLNQSIVTIHLMDLIMALFMKTTIIMIRLLMTMKKTSEK